MSRRRTRRPQATTDQRAPEQRPEALVREPDLERAQRMLTRVRRDLDENPEPGPWIAGTRTLSERRIIGENSLYYFVELFVECLIFSASSSDPVLCDIRDQMDAIEAAHGPREGESFYTDDAPADWGSLNAAWNRRADEIVAGALHRLGHADLGDLLERDREEFNRRIAQGQIDVWGEDDDDIESPLLGDGE